MDHEEVDIVAVWDPKTCGYWHSPSVDRHTRLEEKLLQAWQREIYLQDITEGKLGDNTHTDAILCSRTIYGSAQDQLVVKLRMEARAIVDQERYIYSRVSRKIREVQALVAKTRVDDFKNLERVRNGFEQHINSILEDLDFSDKDPLLKTAYRYTILEPANELRRELEKYHAEPNSTSNPESSYWNAIWFALTNDDDLSNTLRNFDIWINEQIIPNLEDAILSSEELQRRDATNSPI